MIINNDNRWKEASTTQFNCFSLFLPKRITFALVRVEEKVVELTKVELFTFLHGKTIFITLETFQYLGTGWEYTHTHTHTYIETECTE